MAALSGGSVDVVRILREAAAIADDTMRLGFLQNIPVHREIVETWAASRQTGSDADAS